MLEVNFLLIFLELHRFVGLKIASNSSPQQSLGSISFKQTFLVVRNIGWPWADYTHITFQDVDKLRKFVKVYLLNKSSKESQIPFVLLQSFCINIPIQFHELMQIPTFENAKLQQTELMPLGNSGVDINNTSSRSRRYQ